MEPESSLPHSQVSATCPYPEPARSSPYPNIPLPEDPSYSKYQSYVPFSLLRSSHSISPGPRQVLMFCNKVVFYGEELLAPLSTPKLEDHHLSAVRDCLFNIFAATLHIGGRSSIRNLRTLHGVVTGTGLSWSWMPHKSLKVNRVDLKERGFVVRFDVALPVRTLRRTREYIASVWHRTRNLYART